MSRYIEIDDKKIKRLLSEAQLFQDDIVCAVGTDFMQNIAEAENRMLFDILNGLKSETAADVVEVVRCKDCKSCLTYKKWNGKEYAGCCRNGEIYEVEPNHYCSYGERSEDTE